MIKLPYSSFSTDETNKDYEGREEKHGALDRL